MKSKGFSFVSTLPDGLKRYKDLLALDKTGGVDFQAKTQVAKQLLNWSNQGSANDSVVPPIDTGNLRGSASVFIGSVLVQNTRGEYGEGTPLLTHSDTNNVITIIYNTAYAAWLHENPMGEVWQPGPKSVLSGDVGDKWLERHLKADGASLLEMYASLLKAGTGA